MKEKNTKCITTNKVLIQKLYIEGRSKDNNIEKVLSFKKPKPYTINPKLINRNINNEAEKRNKAYNEALSIMHGLNKKISNNIKNYKKRKEQNNKFIKGYKIYKKINSNIYMKEIEQRNFIFGHLINSYKNKGIKIPSEFFYNDIYKDSGLLLCKKSKMEDFFEQDAIKVGGKSKKGAKSLKFLGKISNDVEKVFKKRLLNIKNKNINYSISSENEENEENVQLRNKMNKNDYFSFFDKVNSNIEKINKQEKEIKRLKKLISIEEKEHNLYSKIDNYKKDISNISNNYNDSFENSIKNKRRNNDINNSNSYYNNNDLCTSSTIAPKNNSLFNIGKIYKNKNISENNSNLNLGTLTLNDSNNINIENYSNTKNILNNQRNNNNNSNNSNISMESEHDNFRISIEQPKKPKKKSISTLQFMSLNKTKKVPPIYINKIKNRRRSFLPMGNFTTINIIDDNRYSNKTDKINTNKSIKSISLRKNNSQPNIKSKTRTINELYENIVKLRFHPFKKSKNEENIKDLYKNLYGDKIKGILKTNNPKDILKNYFNIRGNIIGSEQINNIYTKYKELLPNIMKSRIMKNKEQNEIIKGHPLIYAKHLYDNKYMDYLNKSD